MIVRTLLLLALLAYAAVFAAEPTQRNPIPDPELVLDADSFAINVVQLRPDDEPVKALLQAAMNSITSGETKLPPSMQEVSSYLNRNNRADMLFAALPFQGVRVDRMQGKESSPTYAITLSGWRGLQAQFYNSLAQAPDGKAYPSELYRRTDLVDRGTQILGRVNGTFLFSPNPAAAKKTVDRLQPPGDKPGKPENGPLLAAYRSLPKNADGYGIALNQKDAFSSLLRSMNNEHIQKLRDKVGSDRLDKAVAKVKQAVWSVDVVTQDRAEFQGDLTVDPKDVAEVAAVLEDGKGNLDATKIVDVAITPGAGKVSVKAAVIGLKQLMLDSMVKAGSTNK